MTGQRPEADDAAFTLTMSARILGVIPISSSDPEFRDGQIPFLHGRSLLDYTLAPAAGATQLDRLLVSTDSEAVAEACRRYGVEVPFIRPAALANPRAPVVEVLRHALDWLEEREAYRPDWVVMLFVTYPFRPPGFIDNFIRTVLVQDLDSAFAAIEERYSHWFVWEDNRPELVAFGSETAKAQKRPFFRELSGLISMARVEVVRAGTLYGKRLGLVGARDMWSVINIHDPIGRQLAEVLAPAFLAEGGL